MSEPQEAKNWNSTIQFPTNSGFTNRVTSFDFEVSNGGNPMIVMEAEVIAPEQVDVAGELVNIAGTKARKWFVTAVPGDDEKSSRCLERLIGNNPEQPGLLRLLFEDEPEYLEKILAEFNPENPDPEVLKKVIGKCILTAMSSKGEPKRATPTGAQIEAAKAKRERAQGDIMKNPRTGKAIVQYWPQIDEVFALAPEGAGSNKPY